MCEQIVQRQVVGNVYPRVSTRNCTKFQPQRNGVNRWQRRPNVVEVLTGIILR